MIHIINVMQTNILHGYETSNFNKKLVIKTLHKLSKSSFVGHSMIPSFSPAMNTWLNISNGLSVHNAELYHSGSTPHLVKAKISFKNLKNASNHAFPQWGYTSFTTKFTPQLLQCWIRLAYGLFIWSRAGLLTGMNWLTKIFNNC